MTFQWGTRRERGHITRFICDIGLLTYHIYIYHLTLRACSKQAYVTYEPSYMASLSG